MSDDTRSESTDDSNDIMININYDIDSVIYMGRPPSEVWSRGITTINQDVLLTFILPNNTTPTRNIVTEYFEYNDSHDIGEDKTCSICYCDYKNGDILTILSCNHVFHDECLKEWGKYKPECPICRANIPCADDD